MPIYNNPQIGQAFGNIAQMFAPPSAGDVANYARARLTNQQAEQLGWLFNNSADPSASARAALTGVQGYGQTPGGFTYQVDQNNATARRGQDIDAGVARRGQDIAADTSRANNANTVQGGVVGQLYGPLNPGQVRPEVPPDIAAAVGLPAIPGVAGAPKPADPLSETQWRAQEAQRLRKEGLLTDQQIIGVITGRSGEGSKPQNYRSPDGKMGTAMPGPDGRLVDTQTGAPVPPGSVTIGVNIQAANPDAALGGARLKDAQNNIVTQDISRALALLEQNPTLAAGLANQISGSVGGTPANSLNALLDTLSANVAFDNLQAMRASSPTGGALGNVSDADMKLLQAVMGSLRGSQRPDDLAFNLKRLNNTVLDIVHGPGNGPPRVDLPNVPGVPGSGGPPAAAPAAGGAPTAVNPQTGERLILQNGQWVPLK